MSAQVSTAFPLMDFSKSPAFMPAFIALSDDDDTVPPANGVNFYTELYRNDVRGSLHVYPGGGHGWGSKIGFRYHEEMMMDLKDKVRAALEAL